MGLSTKDLGGLSVFGGHLLPPSDNAFDIGRPTRNWRNGYFQTAIYATSVIGNWSPSDPSLYSLGLTTKEWQGLYLGDDTGVYIGLDQDSVIYHRAATLNANTLLPGVLVGTPDVPALAANTFIISNTITSGDVLIAAANSSGNSQSFIRIDGSAGELNFDEVVIFKSSLTMPQDNNLNFGGLGFNIKYETADLDARVLKFIAPEGIATAVPVFVFGDTSVNSTDLGAAGIDFSGYTEPTIAIVNDAGDAYVSLDTGDINGNPVGVGLYFKAAADENINILKLSVPGTPTITWASGFSFSHDILIADGKGILIGEEATNYLGVTAGFRVATGVDARRVAVFTHYQADDTMGFLLVLAKSQSDTQGTLAYPGADSILGQFVFAGADEDSSRFEPGAEMRGVATELWTATASGSKLEFYTTDNTTLTNDLRLTIDHDGSVIIGGVFKVGANQVVGARVVDARCDDAINSGDGTTDGVIDALRDAMITHGLIAAA